jgi:hypothetical protein
MTRELAVKTAQVGQIQNGHVLHARRAAVRRERRREIGDRRIGVGDEASGEPVPTQLGRAIVVVLAWQVVELSSRRDRQLELHDDPGGVRSPSAFRTDYTCPLKSTGVSAARPTALVALTLSSSGCLQLAIAPSDYRARGGIALTAQLINRSRVPIRVCDEPGAIGAYTVVSGGRRITSGAWARYSTLDVGPRRHRYRWLRPHAIWELPIWDLSRFDVRKGVPLPQ